MPILPPALLLPNDLGILQMGRHAAVKTFVIWLLLSNEEEKMKLPISALQSTFDQLCQLDEKMNKMKIFQKLHKLLSLFRFSRLLVVRLPST
jgi:hypothetical protein